MSVKLESSVLQSAINHRFNLTVELDEALAHYYSITEYQADCDCGPLTAIVSVADISSHLMEVEMQITDMYEDEFGPEWQEDLRVRNEIESGIVDNMVEEFGYNRTMVSAWDDENTLTVKVYQDDVDSDPIYVCSYSIKE
jgi:hypothetical protein